MGSDNKDPRSASGGKQEQLGLEALRGKTYTFGIPGHAERYNKTTKEIAEYAGKALSKKMWKLIHDKEEAQFTEPVEPAEDASHGTWKKYELRLKMMLDEEKQYQEDKAKVFRIIMGQCTVPMRNKIEHLADYESLEEDDDVVGLLGKMKELAHSTEDTQCKCWTMQSTMRKMFSLQQEPTESLVNFSK